MAITIDEKLLSKITISEASFEISVPSIIAKPTSDFDNAGASFVPSPVTATTLPNALSPKTKAYLCKGWALAKINKFCVIFLKFSKNLGINEFVYNFMKKS